MSTLQGQFAQLVKRQTEFPSIARMVDELLGLVDEELKRPSGPTTGGEGLCVEPDVLEGNVGDWDGQEGQVANDYFSIVDDVSKTLLDVWHVGGNQFYSHYDTSPEWDRYYEMARPIVEEWEARFWDEFCAIYEPGAEDGL